MAQVGEKGLPLFPALATEHQTPQPPAGARRRERLPPKAPARPTTSVRPATHQRSNLLALRVGGLVAGRGRQRRRQQLLHQLRRAGRLLGLRLGGGLEKVEQAGAGGHWRGTAAAGGARRGGGAAAAQAPLPHAQRSAGLQGQAGQHRPQLFPALLKG